MKIDHQIGVGSVNISGKAKKYLLEVIRNNRLSYGPFSRKFEQAIAKCHENKFGIFVNSGTSALQIAVAALKEKYHWQDGDEIIVPALTFVASSNIIIQNNLKPVFVDVHSEYYNLNPAQIEATITPRTKALMVVHLFGQPAEMDKIMEIAQKYHLRVIEDSCETMLAHYDGKSVGSFGDVACFSTYACHIIFTGVGGLACTNDEELAVMLRSLANHGRDAIYISIDDDQNCDSQTLGTIMERRFNFVRLGYSYRATEMEAALGLAQVEEIEKNIKKRRKNAKFLFKNLRRWEQYLQLPKTSPKAEHSFMMFPLVLKDPHLNREALTLFLEENNIETRPMVPLTNQPYNQKIFGADLEEKFPVAKHINKNGFYIGCYPGLTKVELNYIIEKFEEFFSRYKSEKEQNKVSFP